MRTLGIDLASQAPGTAAALIVWQDGRAIVEHLAVGADDDALLRLAASCDAIGIDAPFGWPLPFVSLLRGESALGSWPEARDAMRFRRTDFEVRRISGRWPLSVSTDLIALPALRCHGLLARMGVVDRSGDGRVHEVYPRLALDRWNLTSSGYKSAAKGGALGRLWALLQARAPWLELTPKDAALVRTSDDALDAIVAAFIVRAAKIGAIEPIPESDRNAARTEGWIVVPSTNALDRLARDG